MSNRRISKNVLFFAIFAVVTLLCLLVGWIDIHSTDAEHWEIGFYLVVCFGLGCLRPRWLWLWPLMFAFSLFAIHIWAIGQGYKQPYVEKNAEHAIGCLFVLFPAFAGGIAGGIVRGMVNATILIARFK